MAIDNDESEDNYQEFLEEAVESWSYLKFPYYKPMGYPNSIYRVGPLARLNVCSLLGTEKVDQELKEFRDRSDGIPTSSFFYHYAHLLEIIAGLEKIEKPQTLQYTHFLT